MDPQTLRLLVFLAVLAACLSAERLIPARAAPEDGWSRLGRHGALMVLGTVAARLAVPAGLVGLAIWAQGEQIGLLNQIDLPVWLSLAVTIIIMDFAIWAQHVAMHHVPWLWRLHRVHHSDTQMDVTTAARFHPAEIVVSLGWKGLIVIILGAPPEATLIYEIVLSAMALFTHANINVPLKAEAVLRAIIVTPAFHLVHHSVRMRETNSNFGNFLSVWDRLFGLYRAEKEDRYGPIGLEAFRSSDDQRLLAMVVNPVK